MLRLVVLSILLFVGINTSAFTCSAPTSVTEAEDNELYELRTYHLKFGSNAAPLFEYLDDVLAPALKGIGINKFMKFREYGMDEPAKVWVLISYPNESIYLAAQKMTSTAEFLAKSKAYDALPHDRPIYTRFESSLLLAFDGMPKMADPIDGAGLFELRIYEGYNEDAVRRKINMFNKEELDLFDRTNMHRVFFGDTISGPYRPALVYMLGFKDMEERNASWKGFLDHSEWKAMLANPDYANTVSNIRKVFLTPM